MSKEESSFSGLEIPADPTWEPMEFDDTLDHDGAYCGVILSDKAARIGSKDGIRVTIQLADPDVAGRKLSKFMQDPRQNEKVWFLWRGLMRSIMGSTEQARGAVAYR